MTAVTLTESRQYVFWLSVKVLGNLLMGLALLVFGTAVVAGYVLGDGTSWYVPVLGVLSLLAGLSVLYTTLLGIIYKLIADGVEAGVGSALDIDIDDSHSFDVDSVLDRIDGVRDRF
jgi:hypothetical protein